MAVTSKVEICNLALSFLGNYGTVTDIDTPSDPKELVFAQWYDICRQTLIKEMVPNFALARVIVAKLVETPVFGYAYFYEYPNTCLKVLGIDNVNWSRNDYDVTEGKISTDVDFPEGLPLRFVKDIEDVNSMSPEFKILFARYLSAHVALPITQDVAKANSIWASLPAALSSASAQNAQENKPIRISRSKFKEARYVPYPGWMDKK